MSADMVNHPPHYTSHASGVECIQVTEHMGFCLGNAMKYIWRAGEKGDALTDLRKARWYLDREIARLSTQAPVSAQGDGSQSVTSALPPAGPTPATCTPAAVCSAAGVAFSGEERA